VLYLLYKEKVRPLCFRRGESGRHLGSSLALRARTPPDYPHTLLMTLLIYCLLSLVGGPDPRYATCQFIPFDPFLAVACCCRAAARGFFSEVAFRISSLYPRIVLYIDTVTCGGLSARRSPLYPLVFRMLDALQLGLDFSQCFENLAPGSMLILQAVVSLVMLRPVQSGMRLLEPFALHGFLQHSHHEIGFLHQFIDQMGAFLWFHRFLFG
jgi:hypothetical protein